MGEAPSAGWHATSVTLLRLGAIAFVAVAVLPGLVWSLVYLPTGIVEGAVGAVLYELFRLLSAIIVYAIAPRIARPVIPSDASTPLVSADDLRRVGGLLVGVYLIVLGLSGLVEMGPRIVEALRDGAYNHDAPIKPTISWSMYSPWLTRLAGGAFLIAWSRR